LHHIDSREPKVFPMVEVGGQSLIPPQLLAPLREELDRGRFKRFESIAVEMWQGQPAVVIRYAVEGEAKPRVRITSKERFKLWKGHLRLGLRRPAERLPLRVDTIPVVKLPARRADRDPSTPRGRVAANDFNIDRPLSEYESELPRLRGALRALRGPGKRWIDMGAGNARAHAGFLIRLEKAGVAPDAIPELLAIGDRIKDPRVIRPIVARSHGKFRYQQGFITGPARVRRLPRADLITDLMGVFTYATTSRANLLAAYVDRLEVGGKALISSGGNFDSVRGWLIQQEERGNIAHGFENNATSLWIEKKR
jgi:hypothetical protein